ncbi:MAG TPA: aminoacyl-tRNA hydrolase [Mycobacteriales bacterium]|nr:aminoacyl-tRNA hydrolase [Mycobacteriales bacterium]
MAGDSPWLVIGLGNPGPQYAANRHNIGYLAVDVLARRTGGSFKSHKAKADVLESRIGANRCVLAKPRVFMNESGRSAAGLVSFFKVPLDRLVVIHDELDLEPGTMRIKLGGGDNGHNGLRSLRSSLGSGEFYRVRLGIGRPQGRQDPADYVLRDFPAAAREDVGVLVERAADAVELLVEQGLVATQNAFNG